MLSHDLRDISAGVLIALVGIFVAYYAAANYQLGSLQRMGPGAFPFGLGIALALSGIAVFVPALFRPGQVFKIEPLKTVMILAAIGAFAIVLRPLGLVPAIIVVVVISSLADRTIKPLQLLGLSGVLSAIGYLIFSVGLQLPLDMFAWPF